MPFLSGENFPAVFKRSIRDHVGDFSMSTDMLKVLLEFDGTKDLDAVSRSLSIDAATLEAITRRLLELRLIEPEETTSPNLNAEFFDFLKRQLSLAMGPIAEFVIEDEIREFSDDPNRVPLHRAAELVELLARQIHRNEKRLAFQQVMVRKLKGLYP